MHMSLMSRLMGWLFQLPPAETNDVVVEKDLKLPMLDGVVLLTDHYGAFPRFARNLGSGESLSTAITLCVAEQHVYHDPAHPSVIILPLVDEYQEHKESETR
jgi:predicted acyl esterase